MEKYSIYTGKELTIKKFLKTWELDNKTFENRNQITKKTSLEWFDYSDRSTIVLWDNYNDSLVGYITPFLVEHKFASEYIVSQHNYKEVLNKDVFVKPRKNVSADIFIFRTVVQPNFRDKKLKVENKKSNFYNKTAFKILNEALVDWIYQIKNKGVSINYVFGEVISKDGEKYLNSLDMQPCIYLNDYSKYAKIFTPSMFSKSNNVTKLYDLYKKDNTRMLFDTSILKNHEYLSIKDGVLHYKDINLLKLVEKYKAPLEISYTPIISEKIVYLKNLFAEKIKKYNYPNKYNYAYATKANYYSEVILTALNNVDMLETSSAYDIEIIDKLVTDGYIKKGFTILCNGFKNEKYISTLKKLLNKKINVIPIIENEREFDLLSKLKDYKINVGIRYNSDFESRIIKNNFSADEELINRFGFDKDGFLKIAKEITNTSNLTLKVFHFHFGGTILSIDNYIKAFSNLLKLYCEFKKIFGSLEYFDFGGGFPVKYSLTYEFDYDNLVDQMIKTALTVCNQHSVECPQLIGEHGRFTVADHSFYIYRIDFTKTQNNKNWYIINGSLMNMIPDIWAIQQDFTILPINLLSNPNIPVCLGGETCDPDDRYFLNEKNVKLFMPTIEEGQKLYVAIFSIGAYQESISGIGGLHHCLIPEGNEVVITKKNNKYEFIQTASVTSNKKMFDFLDYNNKTFMDKFRKKQQKINNKNKK